jgi:hypothetical protein
VVEYWDELRKFALAENVDLAVLVGLDSRHRERSAGSLAGDDRRVMPTIG